MIFLREKPLATIAFNQIAPKGPWGGSGLFVSQFSAYLRKLGYKVVFQLDSSVDLIVMVDPRTLPKVKLFGIDEIKAIKAARPEVKVLHRINECDMRKDTGFMDDMLDDANTIADYTVFISNWLMEYHRERWFDQNKPWTTIYNGADPSIFHPIGTSKYNKDKPLRIITHHWSDNRLKGFHEYQELDEMIFNEGITGVELIVMGRYPEGIKWKTAKLIPPKHGKEMAIELRKCHAYITASRYEPCGMHHVEGAQCGLPMIYHKDGGGIVEGCERYGIEFNNDLKSAILEIQGNWPVYRKKVFEHMPSGDEMCMQYHKIIQMMLCDAV